MSAIAGRIERYIKTSRMLAKGGATCSSILLYPIRHRLRNPRWQIDLKSGISIVSPCDILLPAIFEEVWVQRCYAPDGLEVAPGEAIIDVGANVGVFTIWAASASQRSKVISIEPSSRMCDFLRMNVHSNALANVEIIESACGGQSGSATLYSRGWEEGNSLYCKDRYGSCFNPLAAVRVMTLDEIFESLSLSACGLLKLDCEGAEYEILYNAGCQTLAKIRRISMEYHVGFNEHCPRELAYFLSSKGFSVELLPLLDEEGGYLYARRRL